MERVGEYVLFKSAQWGHCGYKEGRVLASRTGWGRKYTLLYCATAACADCTHTFLHRGTVCQGSVV